MTLNIDKQLSTPGNNRLAAWSVARNKSAFLGRELETT